MKKIFFVLFAFVLLYTSVSNAQGYNQKSTTLNLGVGLGLAGLSGTATLPPISAGLQFGLSDKISVGGIVGYSGSSEKISFLTSSYEWKYSYIIIGARGEYHFLESSNKLDAYAGATVGYNVVSVSEPSNLPKFGVSYSASASSMLIGFHAGARYALSNSLGVFGEVGYGIGYVTGGVFFKL